MSKRYITTLPDGKLGITYLNEDNPNGHELAKTMFELSRLTDKTIHFDPTIHTLAKIATGLPGHAPLSCRECEETDLPYHITGCGDLEHDAQGAMCFDSKCHDTYFRDACEDDGTNIVVNMPKARGIHMDRIREIRDAELVKTDVTFMMAMGVGDTAALATIATEKQTLRDIPQTFDLTTKTPEQLKALWPAELARPVRP
jgi:hypothetical protein